LVKKLQELDSQSSQENFWNDGTAAQKVMREKSRIENLLSKFNSTNQMYNDNIELLQMAESEKDEASIAEVEKSIFQLEKEIKKFEVEALLNGEADSNNAFLEIHSGAGGTESCDWAEMLLRMYLRFAESAGYKADLLDELEGEGAGIKSATLKITGINAYGWLKSESGVHRLVRISPFDSNAKRHTSFASVWVYPEVDDNIEIKIEDKDLRIDTYRASGAGGQHVNKTESAIRITHIPTNIVVASQTSRSQHANRAEAYKMLKARLYEQELRKREEKAAAQEASKTDNGWGNQIRSYVLHPYQMVKDLRSGFETSNTGGVLDGDLQGFMNAWLSGARVE
jgi:peptide chain release factor 2